MADIKFTHSQTAAINHKGANLLVAAAAGSGKTAVVARRAVRLLVQDKVPANRLLLITFTKAAAAEMRERVTSVLKEQIKQNNDPFLKKQVRSLQDADICTIDSYLTRLLRRHYHAIDLDPAFTIVSEDEKQNISQKALKRVINDEFDAENSDFVFLCDTLGSRKAKDIGDIILNSYNYARKYLSYQDFIKSWVDEYSLNEESIKASPWMVEALRAVKFDLASATASLSTALKYAMMHQGPSNYIEVIESELLHCEKAVTQKGFENIKTSVLNIEFTPRLPSKDKECDIIFAEKARKLRNSAKKDIEAIKKSLVFAPIDEIVKRHKKMLPAINALSRVTLKFDKLFDRAKKRYNLLDFSDLMHLSLMTLDNKTVQKEEQSRYDFVFVDEYQDTNRLQEKLIDHITSGDNLFCVGDVKQSIYSFRQAEPKLFIDKMDHSSTEFTGPNHLIHLSENFRSSKAVVEFINYVFEGVMTRSTGGVDYTGSELLKCSARRPDGEYENANAELYIIDAEQKDTDSMLTNIEYEAVLASNKITEIISQPIYDGKLNAFRTATYSDICILSRSFNPIVRPVRRILEQRGIPVSPVGESGYLDMLEIEIAINILKIIDNFHRDIALISSLNSPAFGFNIAELIEIRKNYSGKSKPFYRAVEEYAKNQKNALSGKINAFLRKIEHYRLLSRHMPLGEFIWHMISDTMLYDAVGALPGGRVRQQNLRILAERGDTFSNRPGRNLNLFLEHLHSVSNSNTDFESAIDESSEDSVKFMSIHKSKGLEFPVVILLNTASTPKGNTDTSVMSGGLAPGVKCYDPDEMTKKSTLSYEAASSAKKFTENAESLRILYVALTRARERLIMIGTISRNIDAKIQSWTLPKQGELLMGKSFLDILTSSAIRINNNGISDDVIETRISNIHSEIILASQLNHSKQKRKDAVLNALLEAGSAAYPQDAFDINYPKEVYIPAKTTATALLSGSPVQYKMEDFGDVPDFMREDIAYDAATRGTFTHTVMQFIVFSKGKDSIGSVIDDLIKRNILPEDSKPEINIATIENFFSSDIARRIHASSEVKKELPFVVKISAKDAYDNIDSDRDILVQGIIDLCFMEDEKWVIVDYKTNQITKTNTPESLIEHYKKQLIIYRRALCELSGIPVKEAGIYFLSKSEGKAYYTI